MSEQMFNISPQIHVKLTSCIMSIVLEAVSCHFLSFRAMLSLCENGCHFGGSIALLPLANGENWQAALASAVVAAFVPIRWLLSCLPPILWRKSRNPAAVPVLAAVHFGDNFAIFANFNANRNLLTLSDLCFAFP